MGDTTLRLCSSDVPSTMFHRRALISATYFIFWLCFPLYASLVCDALFVSRFLLLVHLAALIQPPPSHSPVACLFVSLASRMHAQVFDRVGLLYSWEIHHMLYVGDNSSAV